MEKPVLQLSMPKNLGTILTITYKEQSMQFPLFVQNGSYADAFLNYLEYGNHDNFCTIQQDNIDIVSEKITIECVDELQILYKNNIYKYPITKQEFIEFMLNSFLENSIYWVAEPNYWRVLKKYSADGQLQYLEQFAEKEKIFKTRIKKIQKKEP